MVATEPKFLIDSTFLLQASEEAFFGAPLLVDKVGNDHTRTFGVVRDLLRLRRKLHIRCGLLAVCEDALAATCSEVLDDLIPLLHRLNVSVLRVPGARFIDICAGATFSPQWIVSTNPAVQQFITDDLGVLIPHYGNDTEVITKEKLGDGGIRPEWIPAVLALSNGKKAPLKRRQAVRLLELYGSIEAMLDATSVAPSAAWKRMLAPLADTLLQVESELRSRPVAIAASAVNYEPIFVEDSEESEAALTAYGFWSLVRMLRLPEPGNIRVPSQMPRKMDYRAIQSSEDLLYLEKCLAGAEVCAIDTETSGNDPRSAILYGVSFAVSEGQAFFVPLIQSDLEGLIVDDVRSRLMIALSRKLKLVGHNLRYDLSVLHRHGIDIQELHFDTLVAAHECFGDWDFWNLSALAKTLLGVSIQRYRDIVAEGETFLDKPFKELVEHACCDADIALRLYFVLTKELRRRGTEQQFFDGPMKVERLLIEHDRDGVRIDLDRMKSAGRAAQARAEALRKDVIGTVGYEFDLDSTKVTTDVMRKLGI